MSVCTLGLVPEAEGYEVGERVTDVSVCLSVCRVSFLRPDGMGTVLVEEKEQFESIRSRLMSLLENQITHFRYRRSLRSGFTLSDGLYGSSETWFRMLIDEKVPPPSGNHPSQGSLIDRF